MIETMAKQLFANERSITRLDGWFLVKETYEEIVNENPSLPFVIRTAHAMEAVIEKLPVYIDEYNIFAGTQRDAFAKSYALINPSFRVSTFNGYCDPTDVFHDIEPDETFPLKRIEAVRQLTRNSSYVQSLTAVYDSAKTDTAEVAYFIEQVTGHLIPDFRYALAHGVNQMLDDINKRALYETDVEKKQQLEAMKISLACVTTLAKRYQSCARSQISDVSGQRQTQLQLIIDTLDKVPMNGADTLFEAIQSFILLWQVMCLEQAPNPFAFSVGNADRIFEPYRAKENLSREQAADLFKHFLVFFNVGDRSWAISQNILIGGRDVEGKDLTNLCSYSLLDAYYAMNLPQPILSVKLHQNTPDRLYEELGKFFFTPGCLTPSFFNDDALFQVLEQHGICREDLPDYSVAGCQEPLIMGKDNGNTTNSWLNLAKILELALNDGRSLLTGEQIGPHYRELGISGSYDDVLRDIRNIFYQYTSYFLERMVFHANGASTAISKLPVPYLSCFMGGIETGIDTRDPRRQGTKYNGSGCLIHGLSVIADSFVAIDSMLEEKKASADTLRDALIHDFEGYKDLHSYLVNCEKFGNNAETVDREAVILAEKISDMVSGCKNYLDNPFRPDFATPSTHLIYGSLVGALPGGRRAKEMLNYGIDPLYGEAQLGMNFRVLSTRKLPYEKFNGGYASHLGLDPKYFRSDTMEEKGMEFKHKIMQPLFFNAEPGKTAPFYLYLNITTPETLRKVLDNPKKYAPSGVYIMRIHGTFVNFLDLSPEIQEDIIKRLDLQSTSSGSTRNIKGEI